MLSFSGVKVGPTGCGDTLPTDYRAKGRVRRLEQGFRKYDLRTTAAFTNTTSTHILFGATTYVHKNLPLNKIQSPTLVAKDTSEQTFLAKHFLYGSSSVLIS